MFKQYIDCKICKNRVLGNVWHVHVVGKKHMHYTPTKITVTGPFDTNRLDEVHRYFGQFGTIGSKKFTVLEDGKVAIDYCFQDKRSHSKIIYKDHRKFNEHLRITWEEVTETPSFALTNQRNQNMKVPMRVTGREQEGTKHKPDKQPVNDVVSKRAVLESLKGVPSFAEQVLHLQNQLQIDSAETEKKKKTIRDDLTAALHPVFPLSSIYFFGSSVTGLDVRGSDLDVYIANVRESNRPEVATLKLIRHLIFKCRKFCDVLLISGAKTPIIKCIHTKTQICCDLNIKNKLSVCNSQLIRYYLSLDDKIRPLMILVKFWADCYDLKKVNFFSSYALYMMVIFYLQHEPYNIPSVKSLQKNIAPNFVEAWNCAFELQGFSSESLRNELMPNLVAGFFKFYSNFDYNSKVIAPYFGSSIDKICFLKPYNLSDYQEYISHKQDLVINGGICIQDPFEHSRNVSTSVPLSCAGKFIQMCRTSLQLMEEGTTDLLHRVLTQKPEFDFGFSFVKPEDADKEQWQKIVEDMTTKVLTEVLAVTAVLSSQQNSVTYNCSGKQNIWEGRSNILKNLLSQLPPNISEMDKEVATTKCIAKYLPQSLAINFMVKMSFEESPYSVKYTLTCRSKKCKNFLHASHFFYMKLKKFLEIHEQGGDTNSAPMDFDADKLSLPDLISPKMLQKEDKTRKETSNEITGKQSAVSRNQVADDVQTSEDRTNDDTSKAEENLEEEEEDIPADFFDDFSNEDFMDGLDIVDAWDEDKLLEVAEEDGSKSPLTDKKSHSPIRYVDKTPEKRSKKYRSRSKSLTRRYVRSNSYTRKRSRSREKIRLSDRRDPEKTKRDINRDKIKCAKDKEQKIVNDKLRIVETGLVPPGMEMETDITSIMEKDRRRSGGSAEKIRDVKLRDKRFMRKSNSREIRKTSRYSPSTAPYRPRPREPVYRPRKRTSSVDSNVSDREMWIRSSRKRTRSRSRDSPHHRSKTKKYEEKKKKTFLEEIRDKLNETRTPLPVVPPTYTMSYPNTVHAIPTPVPVPAPSQFFPQTAPVPLQQYDQNFFIGDAYQGRQNVMGQPSFNMMGSAGNVMPMHTGQVPHMQPVVAPTVPVPNPSMVVSPTTKFLNDIAFAPKVAEVKKDLEKETNDNIDKLFADKKISLSDFLTITAKCEASSSSPDHLQKKIKVISRCQDAIRSMSDDRKFTGRLAVKATEQKNKIDVKNQSPLRRIPVVRFQFTAKTQEEGDGFASALDNILKKLGVLKDSIDLNSVGELETTTNSSFADEETSLTLKSAILNSKKFDARNECEECRKRKARSFADVGSQYADIKETVSVGTQVTEEELNPNKGLPKNDSIAYMTPAQLLGKDKDKGKEGDTPKIPEMMEQKVESPVTTGQKKEKPKPPPFKTRGSFRKTLRDRQPNHFYEYDYENEEYEEFYDGTRPIYEDPRENFGQRYGGPPSRPPHLRGPIRPHFIEEEDMSHLHQFREHEGNFTDFAQPFRGRGRYGPRY